MMIEGENDGDIEITVPDDEDDAASAAAAKKPDGEDKPETKPEVGAEEGIDIVRANLLESERLRDEAIARASDAERRANDSARSAHTAMVEKHDSDIATVTNAITLMEERAKVLKSDYASAMANSDFDAAAEIQFDMSDTASKLTQLRAGEQHLKSMEIPKEPQRQQVGDPVEALAVQLPPNSAAWVRAHPEYARDQRKYQQMIGAHNVAMGDGVEPDTPEYFERVERILGIKAEQRQEEQKPNGGRQAAPAAAPVSRGGTAASGGGHRTIRLTAAEREIAAASGMSDLDYAKQKMRIEQEKTASTTH